MISDLFDGSNANGIYLVKDVTKGTTVAGKNYLNIILEDKSGTIEAKKWDVTPYDLDVIKKGEIISLDFTSQVRSFNGKLQVNISSVDKVDKNKVDVSALLIDSPIKLSELLEQLKTFRESIKNKDCKAIVDKIFDEYYDKYINYPAATRNHHDFFHGLLYHSLGMCKVAKEVAKIYNDVDYDLLITGCLLHDIGKTVELSGYVATSYTTEGTLLGHISIGANIIHKAAKDLKIESEVPMLLEHMILAHHGKMEFGSPVLPATREALLLSMIDDMDAKMMVLDKAYKDVDPGEFTDRIFALENRSYYKKK